MTAKTEKAYQAFRKAADRGYGERCNTPGAMERTDRNIRRLKARYEQLLAAEKRV